MEHTIINITEKTLERWQILENLGRCARAEVNRLSLMRVLGDA